MNLVSNLNGEDKFYALIVNLNDHFNLNIYCSIYHNIQIYVKCKRYNIYEITLQCVKLVK